MPNSGQEGEFCGRSKDCFFVHGDFVSRTKVDPTSTSSSQAPAMSVDMATYLEHQFPRPDAGQSSRDSSER